MKPSIIVHGGASNISDIFVERFKEGTQNAARAGFAILEKNGSAVSAVEAAVTSLENNPVFNAGYGSVLTEDGTVEMDAFIMDGKTMRVGAVGAVSSIANPVQLSRKIMEKTPHCLLVSDGAIKFAKKIDHPVLADPNKLIVEESLLKMALDPCVKYEHNVKAFFNDIVKTRDLKELQVVAKKLAEEGKFNPDNGSVGHDTVGAVAIDSNGNIACATSTGGIPGKWVGRVGDTPLPGCGGYANKAGGASSTGHGESIMRANVCKQVIYYIENGDDAQTAADKAIKYLGDEIGGRGGIICISKDGSIGHAFSTYRMGWAQINADGVRFGIDKGDSFRG